MNSENLNPEFIKGIFDDDEDVVAFNERLASFICPAPSAPMRAALLRTTGRHPSYKLVFGNCQCISNIALDMQNKKVLRTGSEKVLMFDVLFWSNPTLEYYQEHHYTEGLVEFSTVNNVDPEFFVDLDSAMLFSCDDIVNSFALNATCEPFYNHFLFRSLASFIQGNYKKMFVNVQLIDNDISCHLAQE